LTTLPPLRIERARDLIDRFPQVRVLVVGDVMLDHFIVGRVTRISPEAPVPVVTFDHEHYRPGGAANVAVNVRALGARADLIGVIGEDDAAKILREHLQAAGVATHALVTQPTRRTTKKMRVVTTRNQQVARIDYETEDDVLPEIEAALASQVESRATGAGGIIVSDYLKGVITRGLMERIVAIGRAAGVPVLVDPKIPHLDYYSGATLVTPNHVEAEAATHLRIRDEAEADRAAAVFRERARCDGVLITRGEHGMWLSHGEVNAHLPATAREVSDVTGAGDTVIAALTIAIAAGATAIEAAQLANEAAGIGVGKFGPATVTPPELLARF
jgi:rfaE bifunctional protein kinase chain/domain